MLSKVTTNETSAMNSGMSLSYKVTSVHFQNMDLVLYFPCQQPQRPRTRRRWLNTNKKKKQPAGKAQHESQANPGLLHAILISKAEF